MPLIPAEKGDGPKLSKFFNKLSGQPESYSRKSKYTFGRTLGAGSFGVVRHARDSKTGEEVAVKIMLKKALKGNEQMIYDELSLLQRLNHPHIVGFRDWFESKDKFYIVTQLATGGELFDRIVNLGRFTENDASKVIIEMLEALDYIHDKDIVHRDLKPENVLFLTPADDSNIVLADFGIAKQLKSPSETLTNSAGSFGYAAPEVILGTGHGKPCDIWSLGVIAYTLLCGYSPFRSENVNDFIAEVEHNNAVIFHAQYWKDVSKDARRFIVKCLQFDPKTRPTAKELLKDPWLVSIAKTHCDADLLPNIKQGFDAKAKFRQAIEIVRLNNRIKKLKDYQTDEDDDPSEIDFFSSHGSISGHSGDSALNSLSALSAALGKVRTIATGDSKDSKDSKDSTRKSTAGDAFIQLVHAAKNNKERVEKYGEEEKSS